MNNYIFEYYQDIKDGSVVVGKWIDKLYSRLVSGIEDGTYIFNQRKANKAIKFFETFCRHSKGSLAPRPLELSLWQKAGISAIYGIEDETGKRMFNEIFWVVGRKCGKSLLAGGALTYEAYCDGEFGSECYCIAPKLDQADMVFSNFVFNTEKTPEFERRIKKRKNDYYIASTNTVIKKIPFSDRKADGYNPMITVADELSSWQGDRGLKQYNVMISGTGARREPITLGISSAGYCREGIYDDLFKRGTGFLNGNSREKHLLPILYTIDDLDKWDDINELRKSLPGLGTSVSIDFILDEIDKAHESLSKKTEFITKYCNFPQSSESAWLPAEAVLKCCKRPIKLEDFAHSYCVIGLDLSQTTDLTAIAVVVEKNGEMNVISHFWLPEEKIDEATARDGLPYRDFIKKGWLSVSGQNFIDYQDVYDYIIHMIEEYELLPLILGYDRYSSQYLVKDLNAYGIHTDDVYQGYNLTGTIQQLEGMMRDGAINIGENDLLKVHLLDTALHMDSESRRLKIVKLNKNSHIDGVASLLDALVVKEKHYEIIGEQLRNEDD